MRQVSLAFLVATALVLVRPIDAAERPNIVFIFADDLAFDAIGAAGNTVVKTPNIDRLSAEGTTFSRAYNMGSYSGAVCIASRNMLNTGRTLWRSQKIHKAAEKERQAGRFWSEHLKGAGYETYMSGTWHNPAKTGKAFHYVTNVRPGMPNQTKEGYNRPIDGKPDPWSPYDPKFRGFWKGGKHWSEVLADDAEGFLKQAKGRAAPFFMYLAFNAPHDPRQAPKEFVDRYPPEKIPLPKNFIPEYPHNEAAKTGRKLRDERLAPFPRTPRSVKVNRGEYYAIIEHMDVQIGRILKALEDTGKAKNTWVFFTADHGLAVGQHGLMGKQNLYDHSVRVPFIVRGPGVTAGARNPARIYLQDVLPTTLEIAGIGKQKHIEFHSLMPLIKGTSTKGREAIYGAYLDAQRSITVGDHKLILYPKVKKLRLYNLAVDPLEMKDLASDAAEKPRIAKLFQRLLAEQKILDDAVDLKAAYPEL
ncbi:MAG: sulfatase-like hydrolase/transferase [Planctomycetota bacterium]